MANLTYGYARRDAPPFNRARWRALASFAGVGEDPTLYHVLIIGQSNGAAAYTANNFWTNVVTLTPFSLRQLMMASGVRGGISPIAGNIGVVQPPISGATPLYEQDDTVGFHGETVASGLAMQLESLSRKSLLITSCAIDGQRWSNINKGTVPYANSLAHFRFGVALARSRGRPYRLLALACLHGEADQSFLNTSYGANLLQWWTDYNNDAAAITGQQAAYSNLGTNTNNAAAPLFLSQQWGEGDLSGGATLETQSSCYQTWQAAIANPDKLVMYGTRQQYNAHGDLLHHSAWDRFHEGLLLGRVIDQVCFRHVPWVPFVCTSATLSGSTITAVFSVPYPPMQVDLLRALNGGVTLGLGYTDDTSPPSVSSAALNADGVSAAVTLSGAPTTVTPSTRRLRYCFGGTSGSQAGFADTQGATIHGNLCDSDPRPLLQGYDGRNFACKFSIQVN